MLHKISRKNGLEMQMLKKVVKYFCILGKNRLKKLRRVAGKAFARKREMHDKVMMFL
jgi:hypothetical protein